MSYRVPAHVRHRLVADEVVLLDTRTDTYLGLNRTASVVWQALVEGRLASAPADLEARFEVTREAARADVDRLVDDLLGQGLIERDPA